MTYRYSEINQHDALYIAARKYPGGVEALAQRLAMSPDTLYKKLRPAVTTHHANFEEVSAIIELLTEARMPEALLALQAFNWRHGQVAFPLPDPDMPANEMLAEVLEILKEEGRLATDINLALSVDGKINDREFAEIEADLHRCIGALVTLRNHVRAKHRVDCGK